jgi:5,5'-dehydrodivanillate O-demethylase oxygenase subunit
MAPDGTAQSITKLEFSDLEPVGPGTPAGRYLRLFWQPVYRARDLKPKQAKPLEILGEKFTLYRGEGGTPHITAFRCPHRGTQLSVGWVEGESIRCRYHGWRFEGGTCVEQPNEPHPFCDNVPLTTYPVREYLGLIWAYLGEGAPPPFRQYPDLDQPGVIVTDPPEVLPCNYWNRLDNDNGHIPWVHRATALREGWSHYTILRREHVRETGYGYLVRMGPGAGEERAALGLREYSHFFMPNAFMFWQKTRARGYETSDLWDTKITFTVPVNDTHYVGFDVTSTPIEGEAGAAYQAAKYKQLETDAVERWDLADAILAGDMCVEDLPSDLGPATCFMVEDYVTQVGQGKVAGRGREHLGTVDAKPVLLRRMWLREVAAVIDAQPTTNWAIPTAPLRGLKHAEGEEA